MTDTFTIATPGTMHHPPMVLEAPAVDKLPGEASDGDLCVNDGWLWRHDGSEWAKYLNVGGGER